MAQIGRLISRYLIFAILPYFAASWMLLSVVLFVQQAGRYGDIFFGIDVPTDLVWKLTIALIPSVIAFTCPTAMLVGTVIGLSKMQGDSELVAVRAAGVGNLQIALPIVILGVLLSAFAFLVNEKGVPAAAALVRRVGLETAIQKLESPLQPGTFNTEIGGYTIYVKAGDVDTGRWTDLFVYREDPASGTVRLLTSKGGRVDTTDEKSELVLEDATAITLPLSAGDTKYVLEKIGDVRVGIKTRRAEMIGKLTGSQVLPDELGLSELTAYADTHEGREANEARLLWQRRILLSLSPLIFCILGTAVVLRYNRGGHGFGTLVSLVSLVAFYTIAFLAEQLVRGGTIPVWGAVALPMGMSLLALLWFAFAGRVTYLARVGEAIARIFRSLRRTSDRPRTPSFFVDLTTGLRDFDISRNLIGFYILTLLFLAAIATIFTAFELWKFAGAFSEGPPLLGRYLLYYLPLVYLQSAAPAAMIATLATYVIKSRQNEIVTWASAGESVYRLLIPCLFVMVILGGLNWVTQEYVLPGARIKQDESRELLGNKGEPKKPQARVWVAEGNHIYSYRRPGTPIEAPPPRSTDDAPLQPFWTAESPKRNSSVSSASDNAKQDASCPSCPADVWIYEFADNMTHLQAVYRSPYGSWDGGMVDLKGDVEQDLINNGRVNGSVVKGVRIAAVSNPFISLDEKPDHLDTAGVTQQLAKSGSDLEHRRLGIAIEKKRSTFLLPLISALIVAPFSISLSRKGKALTVAVAVALWLAFLGSGTLFEQLSLNGLLPPTLAVWAPIAIFGLLGLYLLSRVRT